MLESVITAIIAAGVPSVAITTMFTYLLHKREKKEAEQREQQKKHEAQRKKFELLQIEGTLAAMSLGEATARAVERIPDAHCNGDMHSALEYEQKVKHGIRDFLAESGVDNVV